MIALPGYIDRDAWEAFEDMRRAIKAPLATDYARKLIVYELDKLKRAGHDPNAALNQSILNNWKDVYQPKEKAIEHKASSEADRTAKYLAEKAAHTASAPPPELRKLADRLRRVA